MLNIGGTGTLKPWIKFNSKADKWFVRGPEGGEVEIQRPTFIIDLKNIATGWFRFAQGQTPERRIDPSLEHVAPSPGDGFKRGFVVMCFSPKFFGGAVEMSSASLHLSNSIRDIYAKFKDEEGKPENRGKVPVVACVGSDAMKDKHGLNYRPRFELIKFADRPSELPDASPVDDADVWMGAAPATTPAQHVAPPAHVPPPAPKPARDPAFETEF
jgi:hypothetical protein